MYVRSTIRRINPPTVPRPGRMRYSTTPRAPAIATGEGRFDTAGAAATAAFVVRDRGVDDPFDGSGSHHSRPRRPTP
ncbi:hypothetical protein D8S78_00790 [Natrialba swarupiae]|nr:hypothetical protein [Natrialba swarupiae]